jgi:hypothetical protein
MREVINNVPIGWLVVVFVGLTLGVVVLAVWLIRRLVPKTREGFDAEVSSQMLGVVAALFGLLLAFIIVIQYQSFGDAEGSVNQEADSLAAIVRDSNAFRGPGGERVRLAIGTYVRAVVDDEWPRLREGEESARARDALSGIYGALQAIEPRAGREAAFYDDALRQLDDALHARRDRLDAASGGLSSLIVALIIVGSVVILGYAALVGSRSFWFHAIGAGAIALIVGFSLVVLLDLSFPFAGDFAIDPGPFGTGVLAQFSVPPR